MQKVQALLDGSCRRRCNSPRRPVALTHVKAARGAGGLACRAKGVRAMIETFLDSYGDGAVLMMAGADRGHAVRRGRAAFAFLPAGGGGGGDRRRPRPAPRPSGSSRFLPRWSACRGRSRPAGWMSRNRGNWPHRQPVGRDHRRADVRGWDDPGAGLRQPPAGAVGHRQPARADDRAGSDAGGAIGAARGAGARARGAGVALADPGRSRRAACWRSWADLGPGGGGLAGLALASFGLAWRRGVRAEPRGCRGLVGLAVALGWGATYAVSQVSFEIIPVASITFTGPATDTLMGW